MVDVEDITGLNIKQTWERIRFLQEQMALMSAKAELLQDSADVKPIRRQIQEMLQETKHLRFHLKQLNMRHRYVGN